MKREPSTRTKDGISRYEIGSIGTEDELALELYTANSTGLAYSFCTYKCNHYAVLKISNT